MGSESRRLDAVHSYDLTIASSISVSSRTAHQGVRTRCVPSELVLSSTRVLQPPGPVLLARSPVTRESFARFLRCRGSAALGGTGAGLWISPACAASAVLLGPRSLAAAAERRQAEPPGT